MIRKAKLTFLHKVLTFLFGHAFLVRRIGQTVDVAGAGAAQREALTHERTAQGDLVHLPALVRVPSADDQAGHQVILVVVANLSH